MKKITQEAVNAFMNHKNFSKSNTTVKNGVLSLFGNDIAWFSKTGALVITNAGWESNTTKERLNGLPGVHIQQKNFEWFLNGEAWNGKPTIVG